MAEVIYDSDDYVGGPRRLRVRRRVRRPSRAPTASAAFQASSAKYRPKPKKKKRKGGFFSGFAKTLEKGFKTVKSVARSPVTKAVVGGVAIAFPAVGVPAAAALAVANVTLNRVDKANAIAKAARMAAAGRKPQAQKLLAQNKQARWKIARLIKTTRLAARKGDPGAKRAVAAFRLAAAARKGNKSAIAKVKRIKYSYDVGQMLKKRYRLTANCRIAKR